MSKKAVTKAALALYITEKGVSAQVTKIVNAITSTLSWLKSAAGKKFISSAPERAKHQGSQVDIVLPDMHFEWADPSCVSLALLAIASSNPKRVIQLGDLIEAGAFSAHRKKIIKEGGGGYVDAEIYTANLFLDAVQELAPKAELVVLGGNHEARVESFAASLPGAAGAAVLGGCDPYALLSRRVDGTKRMNFTIIPYQKSLSHYEIAPDLWAIHGWYTGDSFCMTTLRKGAPISFVMGHAHRQQSISLRNPVNDTIRKAFCPGTLSLLQPLWMAPNPTEWVQGFCVIYSSGDKWSEYTVTIKEGRCILPGGTQLQAILSTKAEPKAIRLKKRAAASLSPRRSR